MLAGAVLLIAALSLVLWNWHESNQGGESAKKIRDALHSALEEEEQTGNGFPIATTVVSVPERQTTTQVAGGTGSGQDSESEIISSMETSRPQIADAWDAYQTTTGTNSAKEQETWAEIDSNWYIGILTIPTLQVEVPIFSEYVFEQLPYTPCRYAGSYLTDNMIVAAHNYDSHFGRIRKLDSGDRIDFTDVTGMVYHYQVIQTEILPDTAVEEMEQGDWDLTLFTCTLSGTQRVTVRCERIS